ncbi:TlpA family protein disulfide reductase [Pedobacter sp. WC2423]|uniref:TlpA family protein disulfide reductase n=1 Tax=Pedobacter sp. WC2423 TaxID=3234142 RepID=UPI00346638CD
MKTIKYSVPFFLLTMLFCTVTFGQNLDIQPLKIGDKIPDFQFEKLKNNKVQSIKASELYKKGILILNFWATWCTPCVREMPEINELAGKFKDNFSVICISDQSDKEIDVFLEKNNKFHHLAYIASDNVLKKYFPFRVLPHNIWIDKTGTVKAITDDYQVTAVNIEKFLSNQIAMPIKNEQLDFDWTKPLGVKDSNFSYRSVITPSQNIGNGGSWLLDTTKGGMRYLGWNLLKSDFLWAAYMRSDMTPRDYKLIQVNTKDSSSYFGPNYRNGFRDENWIKTYGIDSLNSFLNRNSYCYEISFSRRIDVDRFYQLMAQELCLFFNVKVKMMSRLTDCWVITKLNEKIRKSISTDKAKMPLQFMDGSKMIAKNQTIKELANQLSAYYPSEPHFVDESRLEKGINLLFDFTDPSDPAVSIKKMRKALNGIGLEIKLKKHLFPYLIINELE